MKNLKHTNTITRLRFEKPIIRREIKNVICKREHEGSIRKPDPSGTTKFAGPVASRWPVAKRTTTPKTRDRSAPQIAKTPKATVAVVFPSTTTGPAAEITKSEPNDNSVRIGNVVNVSLDALQIPGKRRPVDPTKVRVLASSISSIGLQMPISVRRIKPAGFELIAGLHRVEAATLLGWVSIPGILMDEGEHVARRWQFEENLDRAELVALDYAEHVAGWVKLANLRPRISGQDDHKVGRPESGLALAARSLPVPGNSAEARRKAVARAMKIDGIADEAKALARTLGLADNQAALLAIAEEATPEAQIAKVQELASRRRKARSGPTPGGLGVSDSQSGEPESANDSQPDTRAPQVDDEILRRFRDAWEQTNARDIWTSAPTEIRARIISEVLRHPILRATS